MSIGIKGEIVSFKSKSGYICKGILYSSSDNQTTVIHVHGSYGNFYDNFFIQQMALAYDKENINLLAFNLQTHGGFSDGFIGDKYCYVGGAISSFETSIDDIDGAIDYVASFSDKIVLQGHSLGTDKILYYLIKSGKRYPIILISPCDSYALQEKWIAPETVEHQTVRIKNLPEQEITWLNLREYGIKCGDEEYYIPITKKAFLSLVDGFNFNYTRIEKECKKYYLNTHAFIYIGGKDAFQTSTVSKVRKFFIQRISNPYLSYHECGDHDMQGAIDKVISEIIQWFHKILI